ncbi:type II toxin-antitoxin system RelE/ParE family toxin [Nostoc sp. LEGE 06077]|uniref:type II toxin-antitoxin system RelE family toxin n=1 Tax=Nostoc sp. LEGE 06077 TaxID=915325 RepID=UPI00187FC5D2|nr:type II toxin-antitoxin system RelE/ParE family toxin [Nostoc sp. LEGE 06077]MBE9209692.1 type II toxin-antitoxin system RelE/ParE family toxin [Nostoc sp. LEGE 06077]
MEYNTDLKPCAARDFGKLAQDVQKAVADVIDSLKENPRPVGVKNFSFNNQDLYRIHEGHYRIIYEINDEAHVVLVVTIRNQYEGYLNI